MRITVLLSIIYIFSTIFSACSSNSPPPEKHALPSLKGGPAPDSQSISKETWQVDWENMLREAKKEGKVIIYGTPKPAVYAAISAGFRKAFGLDVETVTARDAQIIAKIRMENTAGLHLADISLTGGSSVQILGPLDLVARQDPLLILPEIKDDKIWYKRSMGNQFLDPEHLAFSFIAVVNTPMARNNKLVGSEEIKVWEDLLQPRWKDKFIMNDPTTTGAGQSSFAMVGKIKGWDFWRAIVRQNPTVIRDTRLQMEWVAQGKFSLVVSSSSSSAQEFIDAGAPINLIRLREDNFTSSSGGVISIFKIAPHPNAAKLFLNYVLSKEGQTIWSQADGAQSARLDVSTEGLNPILLRTPGIIYPASDDWEFHVWREKNNIEELAKEIFGPLLR